MKNIGMPMMYFSRNEDGKLATWLNCVDDNLIVGLSQVVKDEGKKLAKKSKLKMLVS